MLGRRSGLRTRAIILGVIWVQFSTLWASSQEDFSLSVEETPTGQRVAQIPTDVWHLAFHELSIPSLLKSALVCKKFQHLSQQYLDAYLKPFKLDTLQNPLVPRWKLFQVLSSQEFVGQFSQVDYNLFGISMIHKPLAFFSSQELGDEFCALGYEAGLLWKLRELQDKYLDFPKNYPGTLSELLIFYESTKNDRESLFHFVDQFLDLSQLCKKHYSWPLIQQFYRERNGSFLRGLQGFTQYNTEKKCWEDNTHITYETLKKTYPSFYYIASGFRLPVIEKTPKNPFSRDYFLPVVEHYNQPPFSLNITDSNIEHALFKSRLEYVSHACFFSTGYQRDLSYFTNDLSILEENALLEEILDPNQKHIGSTRTDVMIFMYQALESGTMDPLKTGDEFLRNCLRSTDDLQRLCAYLACYQLLLTEHYFGRRDLKTSLIVLLLEGLSDPVSRNALIIAGLVRDLEGWTRELYNQPLESPLLELYKRIQSLLSDKLSTASPAAQQYRYILNHLWVPEEKLLDMLREAIQYAQSLEDKLDTLVLEPIFFRLIRGHVVGLKPQDVASISFHEHNDPNAQVLESIFKNFCDRSIGAKTERTYLRDALARVHGRYFHWTLIAWLSHLWEIKKGEGDENAIQALDLSYLRLLQAMQPEYGPNRPNYFETHTPF